MAPVDPAPKWFGCAEPVSMCQRCRRYVEPLPDGWYRCCGVRWQPIDEPKEPRDA